MTESMQIALYVGITILFIIAGVIFIINIISSTKPYDQITFATAESLRSALNEACFYGNKPIEVKNVALPQSGATFIWQAMLNIVKDGDPAYLIYYEQFPIGEGISWETYLNGRISDRIITQISGKDELTQQDIENFRNSVVAPGGAPADVIINNVVLADDMDMSALEPVKSSASRPGQGFGEWKNGAFALAYQSALLNRTLAKYFSCGEGNLCVKTLSGIYAYPLTECTKTGIDYVEMKLDNMQLKAITYLKDVISEADSKKSDFYLVSPCQTDTMEVSIEPCSCKLVTYPVYAYDSKSGTFKTTGETHKFCTDNIQDTQARDSNFKCAVVEFKAGRNGCFTTTPESVSLGASSTPKPVTDFTEWLAPDRFLLTTKNVISFGNEIKTKLLNAVGADDWYWPRLK